MNDWFLVIYNCMTLHIRDELEQSPNSPVAKLALFFYSNELQVGSFLFRSPYKQERRAAEQEWLGPQFTRMKKKPKKLKSAQVHLYSTVFMIPEESVTKNAYGNLHVICFSNTISGQKADLF